MQKSSRRRRVDLPKAPAKTRQGAFRRPRRMLVDPDEVGALITLLHRSGSEVQRLLSGCAQGDEQMQFLTALRDFQRDLYAPAARARWLGWAQRQPNECPTSV